MGEENLMGRVTLTVPFLGFIMGPGALYASMGLIMVLILLRGRVDGGKGESRGKEPPLDVAFSHST